VDSTIAVNRSLAGIFGGFRLPRWTIPTFLRSTELGVVIGLLPAAGGTAASFASYSLAKKTSSRPQEYGKGSVEGVIASESANNACSGGDIMTTLVLGVPGSATTGILLGALTMHGLQAGPSFVAQQGELVYGIIAAAIISQVFMVAAAVFAAYSLSGTLSIPTRVLVPILLLCAVVGSYASRGTMFDVYLMLACGALGYLMKRTGYSTAALVMGVLLAPIADSELIRMFQLYGDEWYLAFFTRPLALTLLLIMTASVAWSFWPRKGELVRE
jgi:putative tricarboxylic transport membrane protein